MTIVVGTDSYFAIADADTYFSARGVAAWAAADTPTKEAKARLGSTYLDNAYRGRWIGIAATQGQTLAWPRVDGYRTLLRTFTYPLLDSEGFQILSTTIPKQIVTAAMEAALMALSGVTLEPTLVRGGAVKSQSDTVGPLSSTTVWVDGASVVDRYLVIEGLLAGLVNSTPGASSSNVRLVRA